MNLPGLERTRDEIHEAYPQAEVEVRSVDITDETSVQAFIDGCVKRFGRIDYAVNVAGIVPMRTPIAELEVGTFDSVINVNQTGVHHAPSILSCILAKRGPRRGCAIEAKFAR